MTRQVRNRFVMIFGLMLVLVAALSLPGVLEGGVEFTSDGYLRWDDSDCLVVREHEGKWRVLTGAIDGLDEGDHVLLLGHTVTDGDECNDYDTPAYHVTEVWALWASDNHKRTYYDHETDGSFRAWVRRNRSE
jgi:hypothetical protein